MQPTHTDPRSLARMMALQALCQFDVQGDAFAASLDAFLRELDDESLPASGASARQHACRDARELAAGAWREHGDVDRRLGAVSPEWRVERMATVDRNTLRLALYELLHRPATPFRVAMNEALELARTFGDADSVAFVNGVLDAAWRAIQAEIAPPSADSPRADSPRADAPNADSPSEKAPSAEVPSADLPGAKAPNAKVPTPDTPSADTPNAESPGADAPDPNEPAADGVVRPAAE